MKTRSWVTGALVAGLAYLVIGRFFPNPAENARVWRLAAWALSGIVFAVHIASETLRGREAPRSMALHVAAGVAFGGFTLALWAAVRSWLATGALAGTWIVSLVAWPAVVAAPAFLVALVVGLVIRRFRR